MAALTAAAAILPVVSAQTYEDTEEQLYIESGTTHKESYINRTTEEDLSGAAVVLEPESAYEGKNVNITSNGWAYGIFADNASYVNVSADDGTWSNITTNGIYGHGLYLNTTQTNSISNTKIFSTGEESKGICVDGSFSETSINVLLDNVHIHLSAGTPGVNAGMGIQADTGAVVSNRGKGAVSVTFDSSSTAMAALRSDQEGVIDLQDATLDVNQTNEGVISVNTGGKVSLTDSTIISSGGNTLINGQAGADESGSVNLDNVNLDQAKNQIIGSSATSIQFIYTLNLSRGTNLDGYAIIADRSKSATNVNIMTGASWNVTQDSDLGGGALSLDANSTISFVTESGDFTNINAAAVMLEAGSILQLDRDASTFTDGDLVVLFTGAAGDAFTNHGALLMSADGISLLYIDYDDGSFEITSTSSIPEPSAVALGLFGIGFFAIRRRKTSTITL